jgi:hypothetical protein
MVRSTVATLECQLAAGHDVPKDDAQGLSTTTSPRSGTRI